MSVYNNLVVKSCLHCQLFWANAVMMPTFPMNKPASIWHLDSQFHNIANALKGSIVLLVGMASAKILRTLLTFEYFSLTFGGRKVTQVHIMTTNAFIWPFLRRRMLFFTFRCIKQTLGHIWGPQVVSPLLTWPILSYQVTRYINWNIHIYLSLSLCWRPCSTARKAY